ncbi:MAG: hypothetical protein ACM3ML_13450 [Micromonosporaceae bacterium]
MTHPYFAEKLAADKVRRLRLASCQRQLVALARCCRPTGWQRAWRRLRGHATK